MALIQIPTQEKNKKGWREKGRQGQNGKECFTSLIIINYHVKSLTNYLSSYLLPCILLIVNV